jgi:hypothetical protein
MGSLDVRDVAADKRDAIAHKHLFVGKRAEKFFTV